MFPTISIITPSFNQGRFLEETIKSVIGQGGDFYLDYIIVDGQSTDNSVEIIRKYDSLLNEGIWPVTCRGITYRWLSEKDKGQADAINKGFLMAKGGIVAWLNSDDTYLGGAIGKVLKQFSDRSDSDLVYGRSHFVDEDGIIIGKYPTGVFDYKMLAMFNYICQPSAFIRKEALDKAGGLDSDLQYVMDYDLWIRMGEKGVFVYLPEFLSTYRLHDKSKTISPADAYANHKECLETVIKYYHWAPFNRVYSYCFQAIMHKGPSLLTDVRLVSVLLSLLFSVAKYLKLNKSVRLDDLKMINAKNAGKLFKEQREIFREY